MTKAFIFYFLISLSTKAQQIDNAKIFNELMNELYRIEDCHKIIKPPFFKCCPADTFSSIKQIMDCCNQSNIPLSKRVYCTECINESELDTLEFLIIINDTLATLNKVKCKNIVLKELTKKSAYYDFVNNIDKFQTSPFKLNITSLKQKNVTFITKSSFLSQSKEIKYGKMGKQFTIGYMNFSSIVFNRKMTLGVFQVTFLGGRLCGYSRYVLIRRSNNEWNIYKKIPLGDF
ncbi:MAG: hypothetical protein KAY50_06445 [Chitinophagaceae bacterium]|nr:hypothetical protein [Chitinophagaceae bacterium]MBP8114977.1 hypothetical protein [Chitinophagaceae bacterium]